MANNIPLTSGIRSNLLLLQQTSSLLEKTQLRLATGNKINSALDGPAAFFAAKGLTQRAGDLDALKDGIGQAISTIKAGDGGITAIESQIEQARGLTTQALGALGNDANSVKLRNSLAQQYNNVLRQIDKLAQDSGYQGKNLLVGSGLRLDATASSKSAVNALTGISGARATNVVDADTYAISVVGDGAITGNSNDIANAERDRGISNVEITGFASESCVQLRQHLDQAVGRHRQGQDLHDHRRLADLHADLHQCRGRCRRGFGHGAALLRQLHQRNAHQL